MTSRPSETLTATVATIIAAVVGILGAYGIHIAAAVSTGVIVIIGYIGAGITWWTAKKQRAGVKTSAPDGTVKAS